MGYDGRAVVLEASGDQVLDWHIGAAQVSKAKKAKSTFGAGPRELLQ